MSSGLSSYFSCLHAYYTYAMLLYRAAAVHSPWCMGGSIPGGFRLLHVLWYRLGQEYHSKSSRSCHVPTAVIIMHDILAIMQCGCIFLM